MLTFRFSGVDGFMAEPERLTSGMVGKQAQLEFSADWDGLAKTVVFSAGNVTRDVVYTGSPVTIPAEVLAVPLKTLHVGVYGVSDDGTVVIPTIRARGPEIIPGADPSGDPGTDPDLEIWAQLQTLMGSLDELTTGENGSLVGAINEVADRSRVWTVTVSCDEGTYTSDKNVDEIYAASQTGSPVACRWEREGDFIQLPLTQVVPGTVAIFSGTLDGQLYRVAVAEGTVVMEISEAVGEDGGYYTPTVTQVDESTMEVSFATSKDGMSKVASQRITLPAGRSAYAYAVSGGYTGTEAQFAAKLAMPFVTPEMFGAKGDGMTDDSGAIQAAVNAGGYVLLMGSYAVSSPVTIPADRKIQIEGRVTVNGECGFVVNGDHIEICGNGKIELPSTNLECSAVRFLVDTTVFFVTLREFSIIGSYSTSGTQQQSVAVEILGGEAEGQCSFVDIECNIRSTYRGVYSHMADGQHESSWCTQININTTIEQCVKAIDFEWGGDGARIHGQIQPRCNAEEAGQTDATLITLPAHCFMDAMIWDADTARNNCIMKIDKAYCTVLSALADTFMDIGEGAVETLVLRKPTHNLMTTAGGTFEGDIRFSGSEVGILLKKPDGTEERLVAQENGLVTAGLKNYTNQLSKATDTDRTTIYGTSATPGYMENYRLSSSGDVVAHDGVSVTGFIPAAPGSIVRIKNISVTTAQLLYVIAYDAGNTKTGHAQWNGAGHSSCVLENLGDGLYNMTVSLTADVYGEGFNAFRISSGGFTADTIITVDELIDGSFEMVKTVNGRSGNVELTAADVGALPDTTPIPTVPTKVSAFENDAGYLKEHQDISGKVDESEYLTVVGLDADGVSHSWKVYGVAQ